MQNELVKIIKKATFVVETQRELIKLYESQIVDLTLMSKIELGDDVIEEISRLKTLLQEESND